MAKYDGLRGQELLEVGIGDGKAIPRQSNPDQSG